MKEFVIEKKDSGQRVDKYLLRIMPESTKSFLYKMMRKKNIVINDLKIQGNEILKSGDSLKIWFSDETFNKFAGNSSLNIDEYIYAYEKLKGIYVLYEDDNFAILSKPAGILSQKANNDGSSLNEWFIGYLLSKNDVNANSLVACKPSIVNRLDRNTSGIVLAGKTVYGLNVLGKYIKNRDIKKYYLTYVLGETDNDGYLTGYHLKNNDSNEVKIISDKQWAKITDEEKDKYTEVKTAFKLLEILKTNDNSQKVSKLEIDLITGKSHQIRAHMASINHPLLGDDKYGNRQINHRFGLKHQLLHAWKIVFPVNEDFMELSGKEIICQPGNLEDFEARFLKNL